MQYGKKKQKNTDVPLHRLRKQMRRAAAVACFVSVLWDNFMQIECKHCGLKALFISFILLFKQVHKTVN